MHRLLVVERCIIQLNWFGFPVNNLAAYVMCLNCCWAHVWTPLISQVHRLVRGLRGGADTEYECKACHEDLPVHRFDAERLNTWRKNRDHANMICSHCTPMWERSWWEKRADKTKYTCSVCAEAMLRVAYSKECFSTSGPIICMDCNRAKFVHEKI